MPLARVVAISWNCPAHRHTPGYGEAWPVSNQRLLEDGVVEVLNSRPERGVGPPGASALNAERLPRAQDGGARVC
jgi:hypothetical protein